MSEAEARLQADEAEKQEHISALETAHRDAMAQLQAKSQEEKDKAELLLNESSASVSALKAEMASQLAEAEQQRQSDLTALELKREQERNEKESLVSELITSKNARLAALLPHFNDSLAKVAGVRDAMWEGEMLKKENEKIAIIESEKQKYAEERKSLLLDKETLALALAKQKEEAALLKALALERETLLRQAEISKAEAERHEEELKQKDWEAEEAAKQIVQERMSMRLEKTAFDIALAKHQEDIARLAAIDKEREPIVKEKQEMHSEGLVEQKHLDVIAAERQALLETEADQGEIINVSPSPLDKKVTVATPVRWKEVAVDIDQLLEDENQQRYEGSPEHESSTNQVSATESPESDDDVEVKPFGNVNRRNSESGKEARVLEAKRKAEARLNSILSEPGPTPTTDGDAKQTRRSSVTKSVRFTDSESTPTVSEDIKPNNPNDPQEQDSFDGTKLSLNSIFPSVDSEIVTKQGEDQYGGIADKEDENEIHGSPAKEFDSDNEDGDEDEDDEDQFSGLSIKKKSVEQQRSAKRRWFKEFYTSVTTMLSAKPSFVIKTRRICDDAFIYSNPDANIDKDIYIHPPCENVGSAKHKVFINVIKIDDEDMIVRERVITPELYGERNHPFHMFVGPFVHIVGSESGEDGGESYDVCDVIISETVEKSLRFLINSPTEVSSNLPSGGFVAKDVFLAIIERVSKLARTELSTEFSVPRIKSKYRNRPSYTHIHTDSHTNPLSVTGFPQPYTIPYIVSFTHPPIHIVPSWGAVFLRMYDTDIDTGMRRFAKNIEGQYDAVFQREHAGQCLGVVVGNTFSEWSLNSSCPFARQHTIAVRGTFRFSLCTTDDAGLSIYINCTTHAHIKSTTTAFFITSPFLYESYNDAGEDDSVLVCECVFSEFQLKSWIDDQITGFSIDPQYEITDPPAHIISMVLELLSKQSGCKFKSHRILSHVIGVRHAVTIDTEYFQRPIDADEKLEIERETIAARESSMMRKYEAGRTIPHQSMDDMERAMVEYDIDPSSPFQRGKHTFKPSSMMALNSTNQRDDRIVMACACLKQGSGVSMGFMYKPWQERWLELRRTMIVYYDGRSLHHYKGHIGLYGCTIRLLSQSETGSLPASHGGLVLTFAGVKIKPLKLGLPLDVVYQWLDGIQNCIGGVASASVSSSKSSVRISQSIIRATPMNQSIAQQKKAETVEKEGVVTRIGGFLRTKQQKYLHISSGMLRMFDGWQRGTEGKLESKYSFGLRYCEVEAIINGDSESSEIIIKPSQLFDEKKRSFNGSHCQSELRLFTTTSLEAYQWVEIIKSNIEFANLHM
jgi:hypothetical protein